MPFLAEPAYAHGTPARTAILLVNLGTPEAPNAAAVRRYLKEFLSDPRVVEIPRPLWWLILNGVILNFRPAKSAAKYAQIWCQDGSPLKLHTERQAKLLREYLGALHYSALVVEHAMRYGDPSIAAVLARLKDAHCERILVLPLYPQYAASTTASAFDAVSDFFRQTRNIPELRLVKRFHDHPAYISALAEGVRKHWAQHGKPDRLLMSFHGLPRYTLERGDPYHCECQKTARLLAEALALAPEQYQLSFQSRFGRAEWLQPYSAATLAQWGRQGLRRVDVVCPGFVADCLETLEEIGIEGKAEFLKAGGKEFHAIPCLNESDAWIQALAQIVLEHLQGWDRADPSPDALRQSRRRALALGAKL
ncbi:MAG: ferrochelatase [Betaproteobacteria bacterium]|nr:MAG: ferrochelatase [Betaproteobacteria bacterium]